MGAGAEHLRRVYLQKAGETRAEGDDEKAARLEKAAAGIGAPPVVEVRKRASPPAPASGRSLGQLDADLAAAVAVNQALEAEKALAKRDAKGAQAIFKAHPRAYEAFRVRAAGREYRVPVEKAAKEVDYSSQIKAAVYRQDMSGLGELLKKPGAYAAYKRLLQAGELVPPRKAA